MLTVNGTFSVTCNKCGKQHDFEAEDADFEVTSVDERQMGVERGYTWETTFDCDNCGNVIEVEYEVWEYPDGAFNDDNIKVNGGDGKGSFGYEFQT